MPKKILVIDDEELIVETVERALRRAGYEAVSARSGREALEQVRHSDFDLIITDIRMPDLNGVDTLSRIRDVLKEKGRPKIPEICMTGYADEAMMRKAEALGAADWIEKPFDLNNFLDRIHRVMTLHQMEYFNYSHKGFVYKYVVMLTDTDQFQHMSFANYLKLMFLAADALILPALDHGLLQKIRFRLAASRMQFKRQTAPGDVILVKVNASEVNDSDFSLLFTFVLQGSADLVGLGRQAYELIDLRTGERTPLPEKIKHLLIPVKVEEANLVYKY